MKKYNQFINEKKVSYNKTLSINFWENDEFDSRIEKKLLKIARDFYKDLETDAEIQDIILTGSLANYNYTSLSDLDVHIIINFEDVNEDVELVKKAFDGVRFIWNLRHNVVIRGHDVELYVQDIKEEHIASGTYSLLNHKWVTMPKFNPPDVETSDINVKYNARAYDIDELYKLSNSDITPDEAETYYNKSKELKNKIVKSRKEGLSEKGEFSIENLVFKKLRNEGKIEKLIEIVSKFYDMIYSQ